MVYMNQYGGTHPPTRNTHEIQFSKYARWYADAIERGKYGIPPAPIPEPDYETRSGFCPHCGGRV